jgi:RIO-like serine/threonine protein kinase
MDDEERQRLAVGLIQTIAMQAMELSADQRPEFIRRAVTAVRREFERKYVADPGTAEMADKLEAMIKAMVQIIEESGGSVGRA